MATDALNLSLPIIGAVSLGATAQDGAVRVIVTSAIGNNRATIEPETIRRFCRVLMDAADAADAQRLATQDRA